MSSVAEAETNRSDDASESVESTNGSDSKQASISAKDSRGESSSSSASTGQIATSASDFSYGKLLGLGSYSKVIQASLKSTGQEYALKVMDKLHIIRERKVPYVKLERCILDIMDHPGVIRCFFTFQDELSLYLGLECCHGGELFEQIKLKGRVPESEARFYAAEIVDTLGYIHSQGVIHRDLKPENILLTTEGHVKLVDFGSAKLLRPLEGVPIQLPQDERNSSFVGTAEYVSPEVLDSQPVTTGADMWALGCVLYFMLEGRPPFQAASEYLCFQKVMARDFAMPEHFSPAARDLVDRLLAMVPDRRLGTGPSGVADLQSHPFFDGLDWANLWTSPPPPLAPRPVSGSSSSADDDSEHPDSIDEDWEIAQMAAHFSRLSAQEPIRTSQADNQPETVSSRSVSSSQPDTASFSSPSPSPHLSPLPRPVPPSRDASEEPLITDSTSFYKWWVFQEQEEQTEVELRTAMDLIH